jgi:phenylalanyl-tRNA synthetase beta chain
MLYSYKWLQQFLHKIPSVEDLSHKLTISGLEVESFKRIFTDISGIVTAVIQDIKPHPHADNLSVANVVTGDRSFTTVTGAKGLVQGMKVAYAPPGATVAGGRMIEEADIKSERSSGMIISEDELGIPGNNRDVIFFDQSIAPGSDVKSLLGLDDWILDVAVTPNRPDVLSHLGLAREIATLFRLKIIYPSFELSEKKYDTQNGAFKVKIESSSDCPRYTLRLISGVKVGPSPLWMRIMLGKIEQNSINNIVDITNYVMFGIGQPLHAFDRKKIDGNSVIIRRANNEKFIALDDRERMLSQQTLVIADEKKPIAIAGVMGGKYSGITEQTDQVLLESAVFSPSVTRRTERSLGILSEADYRFERGVDPLLPKLASDYASSLISQITGAAVYKLVDNCAMRYKKRKIVVSTDMLQTIIGCPLNIKKVQSILESTHCTVKRIRPKTLSVEPPSFRLDIVQAVDLGEEIARLIGYDKIPSILPERQAYNVPLPPDYVYTKLVREYLLSAGFDEVINYSFSSEEDLSIIGGEAIRLSNPLNEQTFLMRTSLLPMLIKNAQYNIFRQIEDQRLFEIGKVYLPKKNGYDEHVHIAGLLTGRRFPFRWSYPDDRVDIFDVTGVAEGIAGQLKIRDGITGEAGSSNLLAKNNTVFLKCGDTHIGFAGEVAENILRKYDIKQRIFVFDIYAEPLLLKASLYSQYTGVPKYPFISRDLSMVKPVSLLSLDIINTVRSLNISLLTEVFPFDLYVDKNNISEHSITYRFIFRAEDRTLTDETVDDLMKVIRDTITAHFKVTLKV